MTPPDLPVDEYDRRRLARREAALKRISRFNRVWLAGQLATVGFLCLGSLALGRHGWWAFLLTEAAWGISLLAAGASAGATLWNWSLLPGIWRAVGLAPWAILLMEVTMIVLGIA